jgi:hypothetical protein
MIRLHDILPPRAFPGASIAVKELFVDQGER